MVKEKGFFTLSLQYFLYFGALGIYLPYFNLYLDHIGLTGFEIGVLSSLRTAAAAFIPLLWALAADRFNIRKNLFIICGFTSSLFFTFYLYTETYISLVSITFIYSIFYAPLISFLEAFSMDILGKSKHSYGSARVWGSVSFILFSFMLGHAVETYSIYITIPSILMLSFLSPINAFSFPRASSPIKSTHTFSFDLLKGCRTQAFLISSFLMILSHGAYYGFFSIHLKDIGYEATFIGVLWALGTFSEIFVMVYSRKIFQRFEIETVLVFSLLTASVRWFSLSLITSPGLLVISQLTHAVTYGTFHIACILYIDRLFPENSKTFAQALNNSVSYGLGMMVGFFLSGYLIETIGSFKLFFISGLFAFFGALLMSASRRF